MNPAAPDPRSLKHPPLFFMLNSIKIGPRLALGFSSVLLVSLVIVGVSLSRISQLGLNIETLVKTEFAEQNNAANLMFHVYSNALRLGNLEPARGNGASEIVSLREGFWVGITNQRHEKQKTNTQCRVQGASGLGGDQRH